MTSHPNQAQIPLNLMTDGLSRLDGLSTDDLNRATKVAVEDAGGRFPLALAERLDQLFAIKCVRALRANHAQPGSLGDLDDLIARLGRERFKEELDAHPRRFYSRWAALRDLLSFAMSVAEQAEHKDKTRPAADNAVWSFVAELVLREAPHGVPWSDIAAQLEERNLGPTSKSGVSNLISSMRNAGWLETVSEGRKKRVFPGPRIHSSSIYDAMLTRDEQKGQSPWRASTADRTATDFVREVVCLNQGKLIEYDRVASTKHLQLSHEIEAKSATHSKLIGHNAPHMRRNRVSKLVDDLDGFLQGTFNAVARKNFSLLQDYFSSRSETMPRICIKGNWQGTNSDGIEVSTVIRDNTVSYESSTPVTGNTAFARTVEHGRWCLFNDIPKAALKGVYKNPRLSTASIHEIASSKQSQLLENGASLTHYQWAQCWTDYAEDADPRAFYRSTLVIPMTLRNNNVSSDFLQTLSENGVFKERWDRTVVGFLCLDHVDPNFFNADLDVAVGYVLADLLSIYLFKWVGVTRFSQDYATARSTMIKQDFTGNRAGGTKIGVYFDREISQRNESLDLKSTNRNTVLQLKGQSPAFEHQTPSGLEASV